MAATLRAFVAIKLADEIINLAAALQDALKSHGLKLRWVKPQSLHLTLKFLGEIPVTDVTSIGAALRTAAADEPPLELTVQGMGVFPGIKRARVLWIGFGGAVDRLKQLQLRIEDEIAALGYRREKRGFRAHLTLARIKGAVAPDRLLRAIEATGGFESQSFEARRLILYKSDLRPTGAVYTPLASVMLQNSVDSGS
ncbi:MAG: RNA 2',3'-cyclic phosphodiesterase [Desulfobacteraceae bacterium]